MTQFLKALAATKRFWDYRKAPKNRGVAIEITGTCNAKCYYCQVGQDNLNHVKSMKKPYLSIDDFRETVRYLKAHEFLKKGDRLVLYAWNEPFLHPEFSEIIKMGREEDCLMSLSTNASVRPKLSDDFDATCIGNISLSMPGFSQASYDKIHQFDFERIKSNVEWMVKAFREHGFFGFFVIRFHVYQFNVHEIEPARRWARSLGVCFEPYYAFINDARRMQQYLRGELPGEYLMNVSKDLFMERYLYRPNRQLHTCDMMNNVMVDSDGFVMCCCLDGTRMGRLTDFKTPEQLLEARRNSEICKKCLAILDPHIFEHIGFGGRGQFKHGLTFSYLYQFLKTCFL